MRNLTELAGGELNLHARPGRGRQFKPWMVSDVHDEHITLQEIEPDGSHGYTCGAKIPRDLEVNVGDFAVVGVDGFNSIGFVAVNGRVVKNFSAEDYEREHRELVERIDRERRERLERNREEWAAIESYLSEPVRKRIQYFRDNSKGDFDKDGWGYELVIGQLIDLLVDSNLEENDTVKASAAYQACSGNQFSLAKALANEIIQGRSITGTVGGLAPLTGESHY